jgi:glutathione S-transferase
MAQWMTAVAAGLIGLGGIVYWRELRLRRTHAMTGGLHTEISLPFTAEFELYHNDFSLCAKKIRMCLSELQIPYVAHHVDLIETGSYETLSRHFLKVNPAGLVPVLVHNGHPVYESHDILAYAARHARTGDSLVPADPRARAVMQAWIDRSSLIGDDPTSGAKTSAGNCIPGLTLPLFAAMMQGVPAHRVVEGLLFHRLKVRPLGFLAFKALGVPNLSRVPRLRGMVEISSRYMREHLADLERQLKQSGGPWILGEAFTLADISWAVIFERMREADWDGLLVAGEVADYWKRLQARASYQHAMDAHRHPTVTAGAQRIQALKAGGQRDARSRNTWTLYR